MKTLTLAFALLACAAFGIPEYSGAPRSPRIWTAGDPMGFSVLKYLADDSAADDTALAARPTFVQSTNIATSVAADRPTFVQSTNIATSVAADRPTFTESTNLVTALTADRPTFVQSTNIAAYAVSSYQPLVGLFVSGTNLYFVDANYVTNTVTITPVEAP